MIKQMFIVKLPPIYIFFLPRGKKGDIYLRQAFNCLKWMTPPPKGLFIVTIRSHKITNLKASQMQTFFPLALSLMMISSQVFGFSFSSSSSSGNCGGFPYSSISRLSLSAQAFVGKKEFYFFAVLFTHCVHEANFRNSLWSACLCSGDQMGKGISSLSRTGSQLQTTKHTIKPGMHFHVLVFFPFLNKMHLPHTLTSWMCDQDATSHSCKGRERWQNTCFCCETEWLIKICKQKWES